MALDSSLDALAAGALFAAAISAWILAAPLSLRARLYLRFAAVLFSALAVAVPLNLADWEGQTVPGKQGKDMAGAIHYRYTHKRSGKSVTLFIVCDRPGPVSIHTPDVCYGAVGFEVGAQTKYSPRLPPDEPPATLWTARFQKKTASTATDLRIFWGWNAGEGWQAADDARLAFAKFPALFKLYLIREGAGEDSPDDDSCVELMRQLLPELRRALFAPAS